ncbi:helix-turn-helix domain-containing protein [Nocardia exalbida]|uniref:helix-turn-helix domain-containing protein n=1 Tax=Nocardia exalbida TaxID=290231 RepID=UPI001C3F3469|nr:MerR family transcriptional regulator [Nocardia exalbida]
MVRAGLGLGWVRYPFGDTTVLAMSGASPGGGLLAEPDRDSSGYRRYTARDAIDLVKIRILADAGVPLARIKELLDADPDALTAVVAEIDRNLEDRIAQLRRTQDQLAQLRGGDRLFVSPEAADYLDDLRALGASER